MDNTLHPGDMQLVGIPYKLNCVFVNCLTRYTADKEEYGNQTNLAIKGIIAIGAMAEMSALVGRTDDQQSFQVDLQGQYYF